MRELSTIQKREKLNRIFAYDEAGIGSACHEYAIRAADQLAENGDDLIAIIQSKPSAK